MATPKLVFGTGLLTKDHGCSSAEDVKPWLQALLESKAQGLVDEIDTAHVYPDVEDYLGELDFGSHFAIGTKTMGGVNPVQPSTKDTVIAQAKGSLKKLGVTQVDRLCIHCPDNRVPFEDTLSGIDALYKEGAFKRFALSNHTAEEVEKVVQICKDKGFVLPTVFEGSYNAFTRLAESELLPVIRKHKMAFYAYSPIAGGFPAKTSADFRNQSFKTGTRWNKNTFLGSVYQHQYNNERALEALDKWHEIAAAEGISSVEMAYRWVVHNSALDGSLGDGIVIGASSIDQWKSDVAAIQKGPLTAETAAKINSLWGSGLNTVFDNWQAILAVTGAK